VARVRVVLPSPEPPLRDEEVRYTLRSDGAVLRSVLQGGEPSMPADAYSNRRRWSQTSIWQWVPARFAARPDVVSAFAGQLARVYPTALAVVVEPPYGPAR
jgi:hypothetical protein